MAPSQQEKFWQPEISYTKSYITENLERRNIIPQEHNIPQNLHSYDDWGSGYRESAVRIILDSCNLGCVSLSYLK